jgi:hypothetical protein
MVQVGTGCWYRLDKLFSVYKLGLVLEGWNPHISVGVEICKLGLVFESLYSLGVGAHFSVGADKPLEIVVFM